MPQKAQTFTPKPTVQKTESEHQAFDMAMGYQKAMAAQKQAAKTQRLAQLDIGAAEKRAAELKAAAKDAKTAQAAVDADPKYTYWDGVYESAGAANEAYLADSNAAWETRKKIDDELAALNQDIESAKLVQYSLLPTRDDFQVYAARGGGMKNNAVMPVKRSGDGAVIGLEVMEKLFPKTQESSPTKSIYDKLTDEEARIYNYLLAKDAERGTSHAFEYLSFMMDPMKARRGREQADLVKNSGPLRPVATVGYGLASGFDRAVTGIAQNFSDTPIPASELQYGAGYVREDLDGAGPKILGSSLGQIGFDLAVTTGNMAPSIGAGVVGGPAAAAGVTFLSAGGNAYGEALAQGYSKGEARAYGILAGASEAGLQYALSGISSLGGKLPNSEAVQSALNNIQRAALRIPAKYAVAAAGEMTEEYLQEILTPVFRNLALGENNEFKLFTEDAAYAALLAALSVGVLEGPNIVGTDLRLDKLGKNLRGKWEGDTLSVTRLLIDLGIKEEKGSDAYKSALEAKTQLDSRGTVNDMTLGTLYNDVMTNLKVKGPKNGDMDPRLTVQITENVATSDKGKIRRLVPATVTQLTTFIRNALQGKNTLQYIKVSDVDPTLVKVVKQQFGIDITGFSHVLKDNDIRHINKSHGDKSSDKYKVTVDMLANVQDVIENCDTIYLGYDTKDGHQTIVYEKKDGTRTFYVEEVLDEGGLSSKQMMVVGENSKPSFLKKYKKTINRTPDTDVATSSRTTSDSSPGNHVQDAESPVDLISIIPQPPVAVNSDAADTPSGQELLRQLAVEMVQESMRSGDLGPLISEIPPRPVQQSTQEILSRLAREMTQDPGDSLTALSDEDIKAMLDEIARGQGGEAAAGETDISGEADSESDIGDAVRRTIKSVTQREKVVGFARLPKEIQQSFCSELERATPEAQKALQDIYLKTDYIFGDGLRSYYAGGPFKNIVYISKQASPSTVAHELFHQLDRKSQISKGFTESLMKDYTVLNLKSGFDIKGYLVQKFPEMFSRTSKAGEPLIGERHRGIADILNGLSGGKIHYGYGHSVTYWAKPGTLEVEAWAQFGRMQFENQIDALKILQNLFPNFYENAIIAMKGLV
jgi:hypothetical protein